MFQLLTIRYFQLKRDLGVLFFVIVSLVTYFSYFVFTHPKQIRVYVVLVLIYLLYSFHNKRKDKTFVLRHFEKPRQQFILEYQLALLPFSVGSLFSLQWYCFFVIHLLGVLVVLFDSQKLRFNPKYLLITQFFKQDYIFVSGVRQNIIALIVMSLLALALSPLKLFPLVALFIVNQIILSFYSTNEGFQLIKATNKTATSFLRSLITKHVMILLVINAPVLFINSLFNNDLFLFNLYFLAYNALMLATTICLKYDSYKPKKLTSFSVLKQALMVFGLFMPFLAIITAVYFFQTRADAYKNLKLFLDDTH